MSYENNFSDYELEDLSGSGFGGGGTNTPTEQDDTGFSTSIANVLELLGEGPIQGLIYNNYIGRAIFLNDTPLQNAGGSFNFKGVKMRRRNGTQIQDEIPGQEQVQREVSVNTEVSSVTPLTRSIINSDLDAVRIRLGIQLQKQENDGDIVGDECRFKVFIKQGNGAFEQRLDKTIKGRYSQLTEFEYEFNVNNQNQTINSFQVRIEKVSSNSGSASLTRTLRFQAFTEIIRAKLSYPNSALINLEFDAKQFNSVPTRSFNVGGFLFKVPSNATVNNNGTLTYSGNWNGTFQTTSIAINDPIWQLYGILTNERWGLKNYIDEDKIDKWSFYSASVYNNASIPDGLGGNEARFQCSTIIQTKEKVYEVINALLSSCNCKPYWSEGTLFIWQDRPTNITRQFTSADVENGDFIYSTTAARSRFTVVYVTWNDPTDKYRQAVEIVEDPIAIAKYGIRETEIVAYGCVSRGQAIRYGKWALYSAQNDIETVSFTARAYAAFVRPGDVIQIADQRRANLRLGGLIGPGSSTLGILPDEPVSFSLTGSTISITTSTGQIETRNILSNSTPTQIYVTPAFSANPIVESNWVVSTPNITPQLYRVLSVTPDSQDVTKVEILAIKHNPSKYDAVELGLELTEQPIRNTAPAIVNVPLGPTIQHSVVNATYRLDCYWTYPINNGIRDPFVVSFYVEYKRGLAGVYGSTQIVSQNFAYFTLPGTGEYYFRVASIDVLGRTSLWVESGARVVT